MLKCWHLEILSPRAYMENNKSAWQNFVLEISVFCQNIFAFVLLFVGFIKKCVLWMFANYCVFLHTVFSSLCFICENNVLRVLKKRNINFIPLSVLYFLLYFPKLCEKCIKVNNRIRFFNKNIPHYFNRKNYNK